MATEKLQVILEATANVRQAESEMGRLMSSISKWVGPGVGIKLGEKLVDGLNMIPTAFKNAAAAGLEFNAMLETNAIALAASLRTGSPESFASFNDALETARGMFGEMRKAARDAGVDIQVVSEIMASMTGVMTHSGISLQRQVQLVAALGGAVQTLGLKGQHITESRSVLTGSNLQSSMLAKVLQLDAQSITSAKESGRFFDYMMGKLRGFSEGATAAKDSYDGLWSRIKSVSKEAAGTATEGMFSDAKSAMRVIADSGAPKSFGGGINDFYGALSSIPKNTVDLALARFHRDPDVRMAALARYAGRNPDKIGIRPIRGLIPGPRGVPEIQPGASAAPMPITDETTSMWESAVEEDKRSRDEAMRLLNEARQKNRGLFSGLASSMLGDMKMPSSQGFYATQAQANASNQALQTQRSMLEELRAIRTELSRESWGFEAI